MKYPEILAVRTDPVSRNYSDKDVILYALSIGMAQNPLDTGELTYVYEKALQVVPTMSAVLGSGAGKFITEGDVDFKMILHGEQRLQVHRPLPPQACITTKSRCLGVVDKGAKHGAILYVESEIADSASGELYATTIMSLFCRGDGGFGGPTQSPLLEHEVPDRAADIEVALPTRPDQALLYRLHGDRNPLHCDEHAARLAGFDRPILHGLCTYGFACRAVLQAFCNHDASAIASFDARFASPVYPGETIVTRMWRDAQIVSFECSAAERKVTVIRNGRCVLSDDTAARTLSVGASQPPLAGDRQTQFSAFL